MHYGNQNWTCSLVDRLPAVLRVETEREKEVSQQLKNLQKEFDDFKKRNTLLWEEEMKKRDSKSCVIVHYGRPM